jgi:hypothetical protein
MAFDVPNLDVARVDQASKHQVGQAKGHPDAFGECSLGQLRTVGQFIAQMPVAILA